MIADAKLLARTLGLPYFPITPTFPWLGPFGAIPLPSKWHIEFGEPILTDVYTGGAADARGAISRADLDRRLPDARLSSPTARGCSSTRRCRSPGDDEGLRAYVEGGGRFILSPALVGHRLRPLRHRPHLHAPLRHFPRRPAALVRQCRADHRGQLHLDRRLGVRRACGSPTSRACSRSRCPRSTRAGGSPIRCSAAGSSCRPTASPSSAPRARTASAPSPARAGTGARSPRWARSWC